MWKAPDRKKGEVSQSFNDGIVQICRTTDGGAAGYRPVPVLEERFTLRFAEQRLGINRLYQGRQNQVEIARVIRVQKAGEVLTQDVAVIGGDPAQLPHLVADVAHLLSQFIVRHRMHHSFHR